MSKHRPRSRTPLSSDGGLDILGMSKDLVADEGVSRSAQSSDDIELSFVLERTPERTLKFVAAGDSVAFQVEEKEIAAYISGHLAGYVPRREKGILSPHIIGGIYQSRVADVFERSIRVRVNLGQTGIN